jgi:hypothetical protein
MTVFQHHIYEYRKGLRNLVLHTMPASQRKNIEDCLRRKGIEFVLYPLGATRVNVFFGARGCVEVIRRIGKPSLSEYSPEEDFILGTMLGYDNLRQCSRYLRNKSGGKTDEAFFRGKKGEEPRLELMKTA